MGQPARGDEHSEEAQGDPTEHRAGPSSDEGDAEHHEGRRHQDPAPPDHVTSAARQGPPGRPRQPEIDPEARKGGRDQQHNAPHIVRLSSERRGPAPGHPGPQPGVRLRCRRSGRRRRVDAAGLPCGSTRAAGLRTPAAVAFLAGGGFRPPLGAGVEALLRLVVVATVATTVTPPHQSQQYHPRRRRRAYNAEGQTSITTGTIMGRRRVRSWTKRPSAWRAWRFNVS